MNIPKVGQKYKCVAWGWGRASWNDILEVYDVEHYEDGTCYVCFIHGEDVITWCVHNYPNDFKLVELTTEHGTFYVDDLGSKPPVDGGKPPLGLQSWQAHDSLRVQDILAAMQRYVAANKAVPEAWLEELIDKIELEYE